ncbi:hypothetical protein EF879_21435 [Micromonospora sp. HM5-17]|nr:hypothetical protein EF879_21435 [Micromonospora sp. HM5-17]
MNGWVAVLAGLGLTTATAAWAIRWSAVHPSPRTDGTGDAPVRRHRPAGRAARRPAPPPRRPR